MFWLSESFYTLFDRSAKVADSKEKKAQCEADVVIVGTGYGGSISAQQLAEYYRERTKQEGGKVRILVLERGREFLPGEFPEDLSDLPGQIRINRPQESTAAKNLVQAASANSVGFAGSLFQVFPGGSRSSVSVVVGTALGGGSQVNAGVAKQPHPSVFNNKQWPKALRNRGDQELHESFKSVLDGLNAKPLPRRLKPKKLLDLERLHERLQAEGHLDSSYLQGAYKATFERPPIAVNFEKFLNLKNAFGVTQPPCNSCGNCCSGCNTGAKNTLTTNYLPRAKIAGAEIYTDALVDQIEWDEAGKFFTLLVHPTASLDAPDKDRLLKIKSKIVILAAGSLGSTAILLRSEQLKKNLSPKLGKQFSTNGDSISARYKSQNQIFPMGLGLAADKQPLENRPGPTITGAIQIAPKDPESLLPTFIVEDCAIPLAMSEVSSELMTTAALLHRMTATFGSPPDADTVDPLANDPVAIESTAYYLTMTRDSSAGEIVLADSNSANRGGISHAQIIWDNNGATADTEPPHKSANLSNLDKLLSESDDGNGTYIPNPARVPVPPALSSIMTKLPEGAVVTVHPLGGCPMGDTVAQGVVDDRGRVFRRKGKLGDEAVIQGLYVFDGSIVPCALETNPYLTISALAHRGITALIREDLDDILLTKKVAAPNVVSLSKQPIIARTAVTAKSTEFVFRERLRQKVLRPKGLELFLKLDPTIANADYAAGFVYLEFELSYAPENLIRFLKDPRHEATLNGTIRLVKRGKKFPAFSESDWQPVSNTVQLTGGTINLFEPDSGPSIASAARAFYVYSKRRWLRERNLQPRPSDPDKAGFSPADIFGAAGKFFAHVGATRKVVYKFNTLTIDGKRIDWNGAKDICYRVDGNVWKDLFTLPIQASHEGENLWSGKLAVDIDYFLTSGVPQVTQQESLPKSTMALISYAMFYARVVLQTYFYEFALPDYPDEPLDEMPLPTVLSINHGSQNYDIQPDYFWLPLANFKGILTNSEGESPSDWKGRADKFEQELAALKATTQDDQPTSDHCLVSVYKAPAAATPYLGSVVLIHGYAISSSIFTLPQIKQNLTQSLLLAGYDVYVADLRTSSALPDSMKLGISYDEIAAVDIPCLIDFAWRHSLRTQQQKSKNPSEHKINVVAHCMGSAQLGMALLSQERLSKDASSIYYEQYKFIPYTKELIGKACFFQVAPLIAVTKANAVRGRVGAILDTFIPDTIVSPLVQSAAEVSPMSALIDRFAMTFPYADDADSGEPDEDARSPWVAITRKAFWLYGQTWNNANLNHELKEKIHHIIGDVNIKTFRQVGALVRMGRVVNSDEVNNDLKDSYLLGAYRSFQSLWLHGEKSDMFEMQTTAGTVARLRALYAEDSSAGVKPNDADNRFQFKALPDYGHLDTLIGKEAYLHGHLNVIQFFGDDKNYQSKNTNSIAITQRYQPTSLLGNSGIAAHEYLVKPANLGPFYSDFYNGAQAVCRVWFYLSTDLTDTLEFGFIAFGDQSKITKSTCIKASSDNNVLGGFSLFIFEFNLDKSLAKSNAVVFAGGVFKQSFARIDGQTTVLQPVGTGGGDELEVDAAWLELIKSNYAVLRASESFIQVNKPNDESGPRRFLLGSCLYPGWLIDRSYGLAAYERWVSIASTCEALILTGDQVYVDTFGNAISDTPKRANLANVYSDALGGKRVFSAGQAELSPPTDLYRLLRSCSLHALMDDHEISDNYSTSSAVPAQNFAMAAEAFEAFQAPATVSFTKVGTGYQLPDPAVTTRSGSTQICGCPSFSLDVRLVRSRLNDKAIDQLSFDQFERWAKDVNKESVKFIVTSSVIFPASRSVIAQPSSGIDDDSFNGYPDDRDELLKIIVDNQLKNIVFLSGDYHISAAGSGSMMSDTTKEVLPFAFCVSSSLYAPMPFANYRSWNLPGRLESTTLNVSGINISYAIKEISEQQSITQIEVGSKGSVSFQFEGVQTIIAQGKLL